MAVQGPCCCGSLLPAGSPAKARSRSRVSDLKMYIRTSLVLSRFRIMGRATPTASMVEKVCRCELGRLAQALRASLHSETLPAAPRTPLYHRTNRLAIVRPRRVSFKAIGGGRCPRRQHPAGLGDQGPTGLHASSAQRSVLIRHNL